MNRFLSTASFIALVLFASVSALHAQVDAGAAVDPAPDAASSEPPLESLPPVAEPGEDPLAAFADGLAAAYVYDKNLPGLVLAVTGPDETRVLRGYGHADVERGTPVDPSTTLFRIGSISKTFTWTAVMMQVDAGRLDLDADINDYLDVFQIEETFDSPITMRHLMTHTAGFENSLKVFATTDDHDPRSLGEVLSATQPARVYPPGARTSYSNWGSALAAHIVEQVAGKTYRRVLDEDLLDPLGMRDTTIVAPSQLEPPLSEQMAIGHEYSGGRHTEAEPMQIGAFAPAGAIASTAADMARWMRFHLNRGELDGVRLLSPEAHAVLWQRASDDSAAATGVSHGFQARTFRGLRVVGHGGSTGNFNSNMMLVPELGIGVYASQNSGQGGYAAVGSITDRIIERGAELQGVALTDGTAIGVELGQYAGHYVNNRRSFTTMTRAFAMNVTMSVAVAEGPGLLVSSGSNAYRFLPVDGAPDLFENSRGARIRFLRDVDGEVVAVQDDSGVHTHERVAGFDSPISVAMLAGAAILLAITTLLGFWRRWKYVPEKSSAGRRAAIAAFVAACLVLLYAVIGGAAISTVSSMTAASLKSYPPLRIQVFAMAGYGVAAAAALALFGLIPAWRGSGWGWFRKLHYTVFALVLAGTAWILWQWNFYGAPYI